MKIDWSKWKKVDFKNKKIELCSQDNVDKYTKQIEKLLKYMKFSGSLVTDESAMYDFMMEEKEINNLSKKIGFKISEEDKLVDIAKKMKSKEKK